MSRLLDWIDDRTGYRELTRAALYEHVPGGARWRYVWGSTLVFTFVTQVVTGFFLWMNYSPSSQTAWESVYYIQHEMWGGAWLRGIHHFTAQAMIVLLVFHLLQVVIDGAYRAPREFNFWIGLVLLLLTLGLALTGYLLPWDQRGYWSTNVATKIMAAIPVVGPTIQRLVIGGTEYGHHTLTRFFAMHAGLLPLALIGLTFVHVALFRRHGIHVKEPRRGPDATFWVDQVLRDAVACLAVLAAVLFLCLWPKLSGRGHIGAELSAPADPSVAFSAARPEWYFLFLFQFLKLPAFAGSNEVYGAVVIPTTVFLVLALMPIIGRLRVGHWFNVAFTILLLAGIGLLTVMAVIQDAGRPVWGGFRVAALVQRGPGLGVVLLLVLLATTAVLFVLLTTGGHVRAYLRGLVGLAVLILGVGLLIVWSLAIDTPRLGRQPWSAGSLVVSPHVQHILLFGLVAMVALLVTVGVLREPYGMRDVAGFSHRWQWLHRGRLGLLVLLLGGVVLLVALNLLPAAGDPNYQKAVTAARTESERAMVLASNPDTGIPPTGAVSLLRLDPKTQGPRYFARYCASCHRYGGQDGLGGTPQDPQSAPDLKDFASRQWVAGLLDPSQVDTPKYFGPTMKAHTGKMVELVKKDVRDALKGGEPEDKQDLQTIVLALSAEATLTDQSQADRQEAAAIAKGRKAMVDSVFQCADCHTYRGKLTTRKGASRGPELTGYGSRQWLVDFIRDPAHPRFYGDHNDRMPQYGVKQVLTDEEIGLIADWLRGDWYEPGRPWSPPALADLPVPSSVRPAAGDAANDAAGNAREGRPKAAEDGSSGRAEAAPAASAGRPSGKVESSTKAEPSDKATSADKAEPSGKSADKTASGGEPKSEALEQSRAEKAEDDSASRPAAPATAPAPATVPSTAPATVPSSAPDARPSGE